MNAVYDGFISRHINRKLSEPIARILARTRLTPNQATWGAMGIAVLSFASLVMGQNILGGILVQLSSVADGIDGSLARLKGMTSVFGGFLDSVLDRCADALIVLGMILWSLSHESYPEIWLVGFLAIVGTLSVSYTRARIDPEHRLLFDKGLSSIASRDIRLFLIMLGSVAGQVYFCLMAIAILTNLVVFYRLIYSYRCFRAESRQPEPAIPETELEEDTATTKQA
jgi:CDP-L-myo-inositol myo-inositolphosphotransferase